MSQKPHSHPPKSEPRELVDAAGRPLKQNDRAEELDPVREVQQLKEQHLRALAEFENTKKRLHREKEEFARYAAETMVRELLPIIDSLDQALVAVDPSTRPTGLAPRPADRDCLDGRDSAPVELRKQSDIEAILKGIQLIHRQLVGLLEKEGVKRISTINELFDPHQHEAVGQVETDDKTDGTIVEEVQPGYSMHGKVIRPAMVKVAKSTKDQKSEGAKNEHDLK